MCWYTPVIIIQFYWCYNSEKQLFTGFVIEEVRVNRKSGLYRSVCRNLGLNLFHLARNRVGFGTKLFVFGVGYRVGRFALVHAFGGSTAWSTGRPGSVDVVLARSNFIRSTSLKLIFQTTKWLIIVGIVRGWIRKVLQTRFLSWPSSEKLHRESPHCNPYRRCNSKTPSRQKKSENAFYR